MFGIERIVLYIYVLHIIYKYFDIEAVNINQNIIGLVGKNDTHLTCTFTKDKHQNFINVAIVARSKNGIFRRYEPIAVFPPDRMAVLPPPGDYLSGRVTLTNITKVSTTATLRFDKLVCEDEKDYICTFNYVNEFGFVITDESKPTSIWIKDSPSRPDGISSFIVSSIITDTQVTSNIIRCSNKTSTRTDENSNTSFSTLTSLRVATQRLKSPIYIREGDILMFICTGNIGKPPGKLIWQKISLQPNISMTYDNITTNIEEIPGRCSFNGTSNLTVQISTEDLKARIRCFEESQANVPEMYIETEPLNVHFQITHINVNKQPNQKQYDGNTDQIHLTCTAFGNPEPEYIWFKQVNRRTVLSRTNTYVIEDVNQNNSGIYICEAFNIIDNIIYKYSYAVPIDIVEKLLQTESESMQFFVVHVAYAVSFTCTAVVVILWFVIKKRYCNREKRNIHSDDQENMSVDNNYAEIERISYHEVNLHNDSNETSNQPITEEEIVLENIHISTCTSSSESNIPFSYLYVNTDIFNTNENRKVSAQHESIYDHSNELGNGNIGIDNTIDSDNSGSDTLHVNQYVNTTCLRIPNVYEDLDHTTVDTHTYESPHIERNTTCTE